MDRELYKEAFKKGYKQAKQMLKEGAWSSPEGGARIYARQQRDAAAKKYGQPSGGEVEIIEIPCHVEYGLKNRRAIATQNGQRYPMIRLTSQGRFIKGFGGAGFETSGHYEKCVSEYFYDPQMKELRADEKEDILKCNRHGYPSFVCRPVYSYMGENDLHDNMYNSGYDMSKVLAKYAVMVINNVLKHVAGGKGSLDFTMKVPYRVGRDNVYSKICYINEKDLEAFARDIDFN